MERKIEDRWFNDYYASPFEFKEAVFTQYSDDGSVWCKLKGEETEREIEWYKNEKGNNWRPRAGIKTLLKQSLKDNDIVFKD